MPVAERERLQGLVDRAHRQGRRVRFWGTADRPELWRLQHEAAVDLINTDKLAELAAWLSGPEGQAGH
jgi:glycerophosphoryl diester phosphodiesterase